MLMKPTILILGTRGIPAAHGGFETFVGYLAPYLVKNGWKVIVYCQEEGDSPIWEDTYEGVNLVHISIRGNGVRSTIIFDWISLRDALKREGLLLTFGYATGAFSMLPRLKNRRHVINMDGIEWKRSQFGWVGKLAYYINERFAATFAHRLIADHPCVADHLATRVSRHKITTIPYGAEYIGEVDLCLLSAYKIKPDCFCVIIARPEPDNSILELVRAFSRCRRNRKLVLLGNLREHNEYHTKIRRVASDEVVFAGAIYKKSTVQSLRRHARFYAHGHQVGGTNPSLVEALGAGSAILAHDNQFNRWVAGDSAVYFSNEDQIDALVDKLLYDDDLVVKLRQAAIRRFKSAFTWSKILPKYRDMLSCEFSLDDMRT